jgi:hypothetical protein
VGRRFGRCGLIRDHFEKLSAPGILGCYTCFEATEIFIINCGAPPSNLFTIIVGGDGSADQQPRYLTPRPISLKPPLRWKIGIKRKWLNRQQMLVALARWQNDGLWQLGDEAQSVGKLRSIQPQFVPSDGYAAKPWNRILKNNFWNGSYLLELADNEKAPFAPIFEDPALLQDLSQKISEALPIDLAGLSDRLGNIVIQLPITAVTSKMVALRDQGVLGFRNVWHSSVQPRPLRVAVEEYQDEVLKSYASADVNAPETQLSFPSANRGHRWWLWDDANQLLLGASSECSFLTSMSVTMNMISGQNRKWTLPSANGALPTEISVSHPQEPMIIGEPRQDENGSHTRFRMYREESKAAAEALRFVQYGGSNKDRNAEQARALGDLRMLINRYGSKGAWLWDPYLSGTDLLNTLFFSPLANAELRGLTAGGIVPGENLPELKDGTETNRRQSWIEAQKVILNSNGDSPYGLNLTFRIAFGPSAFPFHDRFLIFPRAEQGALTWSLGTSVNALGRQHHILQQVSDGQLVADAFEQLWHQLSDPKHLVWSRP